MSSVIVPLNPFSDQIVTSPRRAEHPVKGLNDQALQKLVSAAAAVEPAPRRGGRVQLVTSPAGGYGKSHLAGRMFRELGRRASTIYVRPWSDPESCWIVLLHTILQDLLMPEFPDDASHGEFPPTQLDALAHGVFGEMLIGLLESGEFEYGDPEFVKDRLRHRTFEKWDLGNPQSNWGVWAGDMLSRYEETESRETRVLKVIQARTENLLSSSVRPQAWLRVLRRFALNRGDSANRDLCLEWMRGRTPATVAATKPLGLLPTDGLEIECGHNYQNAVARSRVLDLLALGKLFRPFVIFFDQTEVYARVEGLARAFGSVLSDIVQGEGAHVTVVTANHTVWTSELLPAMEPADRDRIAPAIELTGLSAEQGRELALNRLKETRLPVELQSQVLDPAWLQSQFEAGLLSPRDFLRRCEQRYEDIVPAALAQPPQPKLMLLELFAKERNLLERDPLHADNYRLDPLRWALVDVPAKAGASFKVEPAHTDMPSFVAEWTAPSGAHRWLVLEESSQPLIWQSIAKKSEMHHRNDPRSRVVALRLASHPAVPQESWAAVAPSIEGALKEGLSISLIRLNDLSKIYAGWELYLQACQGDIEHEPAEVVSFLFQQLSGWYAGLLGEPVGAGTQPAVLRQEEAATVRMPKSEIFEAAAPEPGPDEVKTASVEPPVAASKQDAPSAPVAVVAPEAEPAKVEAAAAPAADALETKKMEAIAPAEAVAAATEAPKEEAAASPEPSAAEATPAVAPAVAQAPETDEAPRQVSAAEAVKLAPAEEPSSAAAAAPAPAPAVPVPAAVPAPATPPPPSGIKAPEETSPISKAAIKLAAPLVAPAPAKPAPPVPAPTPAPAPSGIKPVVPKPPTPQVPSPAVVAATPVSPAKTPTAKVSPATAPVAAKPSTEKVEAVAPKSATAKVEPAAPSAPAKAPSPKTEPVATTSAAAPVPSGARPPAPAVAAKPPAPSGVSGTPRPPGPAPRPAGPAPAPAPAAVGGAAPKAGEKAFVGGKPAAAPAPAPAGAAPVPAPAAAAVPKPQAPATSPAPAAPKPGVPAPTGAKPGAGIPKPSSPPAPSGAPGKPAAPAPAAAPAAPAAKAPGAPGAPAPAPAPSAPRGPGQPSPAAKPAAPSAAPAAAAPEKGGLFGFFGKLFGKKAPPPPAPVVPRKPMPAATAARLAGGGPPGGPPVPKSPPGPQPGAPAPAAKPAPPAPAAPPSKATESVVLAAAVDDDDDSPEAAVRPAEESEKKSLTEAAPATPASVDKEESAPAANKAEAKPDAREEPVQAAPETPKTPATPPEAVSAPASAVAEAGTSGQVVPAAGAEPASTGAGTSQSAVPEPAPAPAVTPPQEKPVAPSAPEPVAAVPPPAVPVPVKTPVEAWAFSNPAMTRLAELLHPRGSGANGGNGSPGSTPSAGDRADAPPGQAVPAASSSHQGLTWLARCLEDFHHQRDVPDNSRLAVFAKEATAAVQVVPAPIAPPPADPPSLEKVLRELVKSRRLISFSVLSVELEQRLGRPVSLEDASAAAKATGEIHVYGEGQSAGYLWQGH